MNRAAILGLLVSISACGGGLGSPSPGGDDGSIYSAASASGSEEDAAVSTTTACGSASSVDALGQCVAGRFLLGCAGGGSSGSTCLSDDLQTCQGHSPPLTAPTCANRCSSAEYAVSCSNQGTNAAQPAEDLKCRSVLVAPGGLTFYCCPCQGN
jgi:hypothetical protein